MTFAAAPEGLPPIELEIFLPWAAASVMLGMVTLFVFPVLVGLLAPGRSRGYITAVRECTLDNLPLEEAAPFYAERLQREGYRVSGVTASTITAEDEKTTAEFHLEQRGSTLAVTLAVRVKSWVVMDTGETKAVNEAVDRLIYDDLDSAPPRGKTDRVGFAWWISWGGGLHLATALAWYPTLDCSQQLGLFVGLLVTGAVILLLALGTAGTLRREGIDPRARFHLGLGVALVLGSVVASILIFQAQHGVSPFAVLAAASEGVYHPPPAPSKGAG